MDIDKAIEILENAQYNCDNVPKIGIAMVLIIKEQITDALSYLEDNTKE
jgi:hypothetical protein